MSTEHCPRETPLNSPLRREAALELAETKRRTADAAARARQQRPAQVWAFDRRSPGARLNGRGRSSPQRPASTDSLSLARSRRNSGGEGSTPQAALRRPTVLEPAPFGPKKPSVEPSPVAGERQRERIPSLPLQLLSRSGRAALTRVDESLHSWVPYGGAGGARGCIAMRSPAGAAGYEPHCNAGSRVVSLPDAPPMPRCCEARA